MTASCPNYPTDMYPGECGFNGEDCTLIETTLENLAPGNSGSLTDINVQPPHALNFVASFKSVSVLPSHSNLAKD